MKLFEELPPAVRTLWAKSGDSGGYGVLAHLLDVAAVAEAILHRETESTRIWAAQCFGLPPAKVGRWLAALVGLHDFGKAIPGFQNKWDKGRENDEKAGLTFPARCLDVKAHDFASAALLRVMLSHVSKNTSWVSAVSQALGAHHGYFPSVNEIKDHKPLCEDAQWKEAREVLFNCYWETLSPEGDPSSAVLDLPIVAWFAGLTSVADWIGSNENWFPLEERDESLCGHYNRARELANAALDEIGWPGFSVLMAEELTIEEQLGRILGQDSNILVRPLQSVAHQMLSTAQGPTLLIVEAPMGEGKTELAFLAYLRLQAVNAHRGLYMALPTQATGNAIFDRTLTFLRNFSKEINLDIQLVHGGALLDERIHKLRGINDSSEESVSSSAWFSQRRRGLLSPYGVGTIDQALFATLNVKHHFVRLWGLANRVVVLDEVHAYDTYTGGLIEALLYWLRAMNCSVVLMSATLPAQLREAFLNAWGVQNNAALTIPYPRLTMTQGTQVSTSHFECRSMEPIQVSGIGEDLHILAELALKKLGSGGCGAIIVNTVQRAQDLYRLLKRQISDEVNLMLFHARFPAEERSKREQSVLTCFGKPSEGPSRPSRALLIATQVVEQSLDIDFDFLITDLAPIDLLLQRAGRLHRHQRPRPAGHNKPCLFVAGMIPNKLPELNRTQWEFIYEPYLLYRTWALVSKELVWHLPHDIDRLVQKVYGNEPLPEDFSEEIINKIEIEAKGKFLAQNQMESLLASHAAIDAGSEPHNAYLSKPRGNEEGDGLGIRPVTRLGNESITAIPVFVSKEGWRLDPQQAPFDPSNIPDDELVKRIYQRQVKLSRKDVVLELLKVKTPEGFANHPLLQHARPLILTEKGMQIGKLRVCLDAELGITYETNSSPMEET